jgi:caffeoyl-CoA O-methyltransferase
MNLNIWNVLAKLEEKSKLERSGKMVLPREEMMLAITYETGLFFNILLKVMKAKRVLEIGTSSGYSSLWIIEALLQNTISNNRENQRSDKALITIENDPTKIEKASSNFYSAGVSDKIDIRKGAALDILHSLAGTFENNEPFDFIFIDADKENLKEYFDLVLPMINVGGVIATDNVLYPEDYRPIMTSFINYIRTKPNLQSVTVPIGHGEEITTKCR